MSVILSTKNLSRSFASASQEVRVLQDINLDIEAGDFVCIMGSSGSGKSTLLYLLSGLDKPSQGQIRFKEHAIEGMNETQLARLRRNGFGFVFQNINLVPNLTMEENILIAGFLQSGQRQTVRTAVRQRSGELMRMLKIENLDKRLPSETSGGEQQRAAVARALINQPDILFADEPTGALNFATGQNLLDHFNQLHRQGQTIVMVSHDLKAASRANRVLYMRDGAIIGDFRFGADMQDPCLHSGQRDQALFAWLSERGW